MIEDKRGYLFCVEVGDQKADVVVVEGLTAENDEIFGTLGQERHQLFAQDNIDIIILLNLDWKRKTKGKNETQKNFKKREKNHKLLILTELIEASILTCCCSFLETTTGFKSNSLLVLHSASGLLCLSMI